MQEQIQRIQQEVIRINKIPDDQVETINNYVHRAVKQVLIFCNRNDLPELLEDTVIQIVEDMLRADEILASPDKVASISRGDTSIQYRQKTAAYNRTVDFMKDYKSTLVHFRKPKLIKTENPYERS